MGSEMCIRDRACSAARIGQSVWPIEALYTTEHQGIGSGGVLRFRRFPIRFTPHMLSPFPNFTVSNRLRLAALACRMPTYLYLVHRLNRSPKERAT